MICTQARNMGIMGHGPITPPWNIFQPQTFKAAEFPPNKKQTMRAQVQHGEDFGWG